jgi:hypothetical protein
MQRFKPFWIVMVGSLVGLVGLAAVRQSRAAESDQPAAESQAADKADEVKTVRFVLHPAEPPYAALKYRLLPHGSEQTPGNAAPHYFRAAMVMMNDGDIQKVESSKLDDWLSLPLDQLSKDEDAQKFFNERPTGLWDLINLAARREQCDWDLPVREFNFSTLIPELKQMRDLARLIVFKARIEMSRGQIDDAIETLKTGIAIGRHASQAPTLVNALVGVAITHMMLNQVEVLVQQPNCPNLYWTLTNLPEPLVDLRPGLQFERDFLYLFFTELRDVRGAVHTDAEWDAMLLGLSKKLMQVLPTVSDHPKTAAGDLEWLGMGAMFAISAYPKAKIQLHDAGYSEAKIKAMPVSQAILTAEVETFDRQSDNLHKWFYVTGPESLAGLAEAEKSLGDFAQSKQEIIPLASILLPALAKAKSTEVRLEREIAALRCVEAIRLYAAEHTGKVPGRLSDIHEVPVPNDPSTGKPFVYSGEGNDAILTSPALPGRPASEGLRWEIEIAAAKG